MLTDTSTVLRERLEAARKRQREARAAETRIKRALAVAARKKEAQLLCTLGRAWLSLGERSPSFRDSGARFLSTYITRDTDVEVLRGSTWEVTPPATEGGDHVGS